MSSLLDPFAEKNPVSGFTRIIVLVAAQQQ